MRLADPSCDKFRGSREFLHTSSTSIGARSRPATNDSWHRTCDCQRSHGKVVTAPKIERWIRRHINGWRAEVIRDEEGRWAAAAHQEGHGGSFTRIDDFELARATAESRIPQHNCSEWTCAPWIRNSCAGDASLTPDQVILVQASFTAVASWADAAGAHFYRRLFEIDPRLADLFGGDRSEQGRKLMRMIAFAVERLDQIHELITPIQALGVRHRRYGVRDTHYESFGAALIWTLAEELGTGFTPEVKDAWLAAYGLLANAMKESAAGASRGRLSVTGP